MKKENEMDFKENKTRSPLHFLSIFVKDPFPPIAVPSDSHVIPLAIISWRPNEQLFIVYMQFECAIILYYKCIVLKFASHHVRVRQGGPRVFCVIRAKPESDSKGLQVWNVIHTWRGGRNPERKGKIIRETQFCHKSKA